MGTNDKEKACSDLGENLISEAEAILLARHTKQILDLFDDGLTPEPLHWNLQSFPLSAQQMNIFWFHDSSFKNN